MVTLARDYWHLMMSCVTRELLQSGRPSRVALTRLGSSLLAFLDISASSTSRRGEYIRQHNTTFKVEGIQNGLKTFYSSGSLSIGNALRIDFFVPFFCMQWNPLLPMFVHFKSQSVLCRDSVTLEMLQLWNIAFSLGCPSWFSWYLWLKT